MKNYRRYPEYKDSGIEWLGKIPAHWEVVSLKRKAIYISRGNAPQYVDESEIRVLNQACIYWDGIHLASVKYQAPTDISRWKGVLRKGDLVINSTGSGTLGRAAVFEGDGPFIADSHVTIVRLREPQKSSCYLRYLLETPVYQGYIQTALVSGSTNQIELSHEGLASMPVIVPPSTEITTITLFLDRETAKIDALIGKKERLIELLKEKRTALISHAVTKGLDPNVPMKDSGIEWLGEIPAHWEARRLKRICTFAYGDSLASEARVDGDVGVLGSNGPVGLHDRANTLAPCLVIGRKGSFGKVNYSYSAVFAIDTTFYVDERFTDANLRWLFYVLQWARLDSATKDSAIPGLDREDAYARIVALCSPDEQQAIADFLDRETAKIDALIEKIEKAIKLLKEYRTALISAAVTSKIDVREEIGQSIGER